MDRYDIANLFVFLGCLTIIVSAFMFDWKAGIVAIGVWLVFMGVRNG
jgi:isochorismate hydrolase